MEQSRDSGLWEKILAHLVEKIRKDAGKSAEPHYALIDSQSVKTVADNEKRGIDGGKKAKGRKRHAVIDTMGNLLGIVVHAANIHDTKSGILAAQKVCKKYPSIQAFCADAGYRGTCIDEVKVTPHNSAARLAMSFPPSAACKFLDLHPVNLRNLHLHLTKNPFASRPPHLCGVTLILFGKVSDFPAKQSCPLLLLVSIPPNWANDAKTRKKVDKKQKNTRKTLDIAY